MSENRSRRPGSIVWPLVLISLGLVFLLNNLGIVSWDIWSVLWRMWPVFLIALGVDLIFGRRSGIGAAIAVLIILGLFAGAFWFFDFSGSVWGGEQLTEYISQPLGDSDFGAVDISMNVGVLEVGALPTPTDRLIEGEIQVSEFEEVREKLRNPEDTVDYSLTTVGQAYRPNWITPRGMDESKQWALYLNPAVPLDLRIDTGVGRSVLDLSELSLSNLDIDSGVGEIFVILPKDGAFEVHISGGVGSLELQIPDGLAARIRVDTGLGGVSVSGNFTLRNGSYYTNSYNTAEDKVEIFIDGGVGNIHITEIE